MRTTRGVACALVAGLAAIGCGGKMVVRSNDWGRVDPDADDLIGGTGTESGDVRTMCDQFTRSMLGAQQIANATGVPRIALISVDNRVTDVSLRIDADTLLARMRAQLNQAAGGRIRFLDRANIDRVLEERERKDRGEFTRSSANALSGADFFMTGELRSLVKASVRGKSTYLLYAFRLTDAGTGEIVWEDFYETKRVGESGTVYR